MPSYNHFSTGRNWRRFIAVAAVHLSTMMNHVRRYAPIDLSFVPTRGVEP